MKETTEYKRQTVFFIRPEIEAFPCWHAVLKKAEQKEDYEWLVGKFYLGKKEECSIKLSDMGNVKNIEFLKDVLSEKFAVNLINLYQSGGEPEINNFVKQYKLEKRNVNF